MKHQRFLFWEKAGNWNEFRNCVISFWRRYSVQSFTHPVGDSHLMQAKVLKSDGVTPGTTGTDVVWAVDNPAIASVTPNPAVDKLLQATVAYLAAGTATITAQGTDENGNPFSTSFQAIVTSGLS